MTHFNNSYVKELKGLYSLNPIKPFAKPQILHVNPLLVEEMGIQLDDESDWIDWVYNNSQHQPIAQKYTGHQFGAYNPDLGDGRGLLLGEWHHGQRRWDIHLKGAGKTPYSRMGDGRAVLRSSIREYLASEALYHMGIPTSRALALIGSDETVWRETAESGAMLIRSCDSHLRFGTFEYCFHNADSDSLQRLFDYTFKHHFSQFANHQDRYGLLLTEIVTSTAKLIARWQAYGFAHGVMNTDNMSIHGITFDYGPYGFMDDYEPGYICNHSDYQGRYAFDNQPSVGLWNLNMLAHAFTPYLSIDELKAILNQYESELLKEYNRLMQQRLGLTEWQESDVNLLARLLRQLEKQRRDYHLPFRILSEVSSSSDNQAFLDFFIDRETANQWLSDYLERAESQGLSEKQRHKKMKAVNPKFVLRNYLLQAAIEKAQQGDLSEVERLFSVIQNPYKEQQEYQAYAVAPPESGKHLEISCSS